MKWHIGTSGWSYSWWGGRFYPENLPNGDRLPYYARHFDAVEINNSFYRLPTREGLLAWEAVVPPQFLFAVKGSRFITHIKRLKEPKPAIEKLMGVVDVQKKGGPLLFQLPPRFHCDLERLKEFLAALPKRRRCVMEFRDPDWHRPEVYRLLEKSNVAFCAFEIADLRSPRVATANFTYVRLHGRQAGYRGNYSRATLRSWRDWIAERGGDAYVFFDNTDQELHALENALTLRELAGQPVTPITRL